MALIRVGDVELSYERAGAGPTLLMIMGRSGTYSHWGEALLADLRGEVDVIVYDHRGVGASSRLEGPLTIRQMAQDAAGLLDALEIHSAHVFGISMGGMIAQELTLSQPERVRTLTLGCTYCGGPGSLLSSPEVQRRMADAIASGDRERAIRTSWEINVSPAFAAREADWERFREISLRRRVALEVILEQTRAVAAHDASARLGEIVPPTLVVHGTLDETLPVANGEMIAELIPGARLELLEDVGHLFFWERPERTTQLLLAHARAYA